jgi:hypothetical protein
MLAREFLYLADHFWMTAGIATLAFLEPTHKSVA